jgi:uncharacterized protein
VDRLLRGGVFADLSRAVRQDIRASVESYSLERLEPLYGFAREVELREESESIVEFETWLELGQGERRGELLERIERYTATIAFPPGGCATGWSRRCAA